MPLAAPVITAVFPGARAGMLVVLGLMSDFLHAFAGTLIIWRRFSMPRVPSSPRVSFRSRPCARFARWPSRGRRISRRPAVAGSPCGRNGQVPSSPRPLSHLAIDKVGKTGGRSIAHLFSYVRPRGRPSGKLPSTASAGHPVVFSHGQHTASRFEGRTWGFITQPRYRCATDPAPACPNVRCASVSPRRQGHYQRGFGGGDKQARNFFRYRTKSVS